MPDQLSNLNATGIGQLPQQVDIPKLPEINFTELPNYINAPSMLAPSIAQEEANQGLSMSLIGFDKADPSIMKRVTPQPYDPVNIEKLRNSTVFSKLGYDRDNNEENRYDNYQPWWEATKNTGVKFFAKTWDSFIGLLKQNVDTVKHLANLDLEKAWKTDVNLMKLEEEKKLDNMYPNFSSAQGTHWYSFIPGFSGSGDWYEQFVPQLGFTVGTIGGAVLQNALISLITAPETGGASLAAGTGNAARQIYGAITGFNKMRQAYNAMTAGKNLAVNGLKLGLTAWNFYNTAASEASFEAANKYNETKSMLINDYKNKYGYMPIGRDLERIEKAATKTGNGTFTWNIPVLMASNAIQFSNVLFPSAAKAAAAKAATKGFELGVEGAGVGSKIVAKDITQRTFSEAWKAGKVADRIKLLSSYVMNDKLAFLSEGVEESLQRGIGSASQHNALQEYYGKDTSISKSIGYGIDDIFTEEGWQEFIGGAMGGLLFEGSGHLARRLSDGKKVVNPDGSIKYEESLLNKLGFYSERSIHEARQERVNRIVEALNHDTLKSVLEEEGFKNLFIANRNSTRLEQAAMREDMFNIKNTKLDALNRFLYSALREGKIDLRVKQLEDLKNLSNEELTEAFGQGLTATEKKDFHETIDKITEKAKVFENTYKKESKRFDGALADAHREYMTALGTYNKTKSDLLNKHGKESIDEIFEPLNHMYTELGKKMEDAQTDEEVFEIYKQASEFERQHAALVKDHDEHRKALSNANQAFINFTAVEEGKKAAIFSFQEMLDSADRSREILSELKRDSRGLNFHLVEQLLDKNSVEAELDAKERYLKDLENPTTSDQFRTRKHLEKQIEILEALLKAHKNKETPTKDIAAEIHDYLLNDPTKNNSETWRNNAYSAQDRAEHEKKIHDIVKLQKRHQDNLNLYNRLQESTMLADFKRHESEAVKDFLRRAGEYHLKLAENAGITGQLGEQEGQGEPVPTGNNQPQNVNTTGQQSGQNVQFPGVNPNQPNQSGQEQQTPPVNPEPSEPAQGQSAGDPMAALKAEVEAIREKFVKDGDVSEVDFGKLSMLALQVPEAKALLDQITEARKSAKAPFQKGDNVVYEDREEVVHEVVKHPIVAGKFQVSFESNPSRFVDADNVVKSDREQINVPVPVNGYTPEETNSTKEDEIAEQVAQREHSAKNSVEGNRTIVDEVKPGTLKLDIPELDNDPHTLFKQGFLDRVASTGTLGNYVGYLEIATADHFVPGSVPHKYHTDNPNAEALVLVIRDTRGNDRFDNNYVANPNGNKLTFSLINSNAKKELLRTMQETGRREPIRVNLESISHGMFDRTNKPHRTIDLISGGVPSNAYRFEVIHGPQGSKYVQQNGVTLRNGGLYLRAMGSYIKLYPGFVSELTIPGITDFDVRPLFDYVFTSYDQIQEVITFLHSLYHASPNRPGLDFRVYRYQNKQNKTRFRIQPVVTDTNGNPANFSLDEVVGYMKSQRINVDSNSLYGTIKAFYVDNNNLVSVDVDYNNFLALNTTNDKKAYSLEGIKIVKPVSRFLTFRETLADIRDGIVKDVQKQKDEEDARRKAEEQKAQQPQQPQQPQPPTTRPTRPKRGGTPTDPNAPVFRRVDNGKHGMLDTPEVAWAKARFGNAVQLTRIANSKAWGQWTAAGKILIYRNAVAGTAYHEAWHHFTQMYLTKEQQDDLYNEARAKVPSLQDKSDIEVEEHIADDFMHYMQTGKSNLLQGRPKRNNIFRMIWDLLRRLFKSPQTLDRAYRELHHGMLWGYKPNVNNARFAKLYARIYDRNKQELFDNVKGTRYTRYMESLVGRILRVWRKTPADLSTGNTATDNQYKLELRRDLATALEQDFSAITAKAEELEARGESTAMLDETLVDIDTILNNFNDVFLQFLRQSSLGLSGALTDEDEANRFLNELDRLESGADVTPQTVDADETDEALFGGKMWDGTGQDQSLIQQSSPEVKAMVAMLAQVEVDNNGLPAYETVRGERRVKLKRNEYGLTEPVNFANMFNNIGLLLEGSRTLEEMYDRLRDERNQRKYPEIALLLERLPNISGTLSFNDIALLTRFAKDFGKIYNPIYSLIKLQGEGEDDGVFIFKEETRRTKDIIERQWSNNFFNRAEGDEWVDSGLVRMDENRRPYVAYDARLNVNIFDAGDRMRFLDFLGIRFSRLTLESEEFNRVVTPEAVGYLLRSLQNRLRHPDYPQKITNPIKELSEQYPSNPKPGQGVVLSESKTLNAFSELESKYSTETPSLSFRTADGNMQHGLSLNNWILQNQAWLNNVAHYTEIMNSREAKHLDVSNNPYVRNSLFLRKMFDLTRGRATNPNFGQRKMVGGKEVRLQIGNYNGIKYVTPDGSTGSATTSLSGREKIIMDFNSLLTDGAVEIMRTESSASAFFVRLNEYGETKEGQHLPFATEDLNGNTAHPEVLKLFLGYFEDELSSIINLFNSPLPNYNDSKVGPGRFAMFKEIIPETMQKEIIEQMAPLKNAEPGQKFALVKQLLNTYGPAVQQHVAQFFTNEVQAFANEIVRRGITQNDFNHRLTTRKDGRRVSPHVLYTSFIINDFVLNVEYSKLFSGNVAFFKAYHKRSKADVSTGTKPMVGPVLLGHLQQTHEFTLAASVGLPAESNLNQTKTMVITDDKRASKHMEMTMQALAKLNPTWDRAKLEATAGSNSPYADMTVADGQGHATLDFYRKFRLATGTWKEVDEIMYRKEVIQFRRRNNLYASLPEGTEARDNEFMDRPDVKEAKTWFPPIKMQYNGPIDIAGTFAPVNDKFSIAPLIPSVIEGTKWEAMNLELVKKGVGYTKFKSGTKKYAYPDVDFYSKDWSFEIEDKSIASHHTEYLKEQVETKPKPKELSTWGTQMRKLFMANMFSLGVANHEKFARLFNEYKSMLDSIEGEAKKALFDEFGITETPNEYRIGNVEKFAASLTDEIERRKLNENVKDSIVVNADGTFRYPLEINLNKAIIQDLISGMIFKKLTQLKINGDMLIQVASSGFESIDFDYHTTDTNHVLEHGTNGLPFYTMTYDAQGNPLKTNAMKVKVALTKEWAKLLNRKHEDGQPIGTLERLNDLLKDPTWVEENRQSITMIGYRIPTQGPNSMEFMEVAEFLPPQAGSIIILPAEIVAKSGSDYDIDKMNVFRPSFTQRGDLITEDNIAALEEEEASFRARIKELLKSVDMGWSVDIGEDIPADELAVDMELINAPQELKELIASYKEIQGSRKAMLTNKVMNLYRQVLESPEMFTQLVTPNNTGFVRPVAMAMADVFGLKIEDFQNTAILKYLSNLTKFEQLLSGKRDLGVFALANTASQLFQQSGMKLNGSYRTVSYREGKETLSDPKRVTLKLFAPDERAKVIINGKLDYSSVNNVQGLPKQEYFSQMINSTVDIASDPYYIAFGFNRETLGVAVYLMHMGVPFRRIVLFMNQPIIKHYVDLLVQNPDPKIKSNVKYAAYNWENVNPQLKQFNKRFAQDVENRDTDRSFINEFFSDEKLLANIKAGGKNYTDYYTDLGINKYGSPEQLEQKRIFAHFLKLQEQAQALRELQATINFDTVKFISPISVRSNLIMRDKVAKTGLFDNEAVERIRNNSLISPFNNLDVYTKLYKALMPVGMSEAIVEQSARLMQEYFASKVSRLKLERVLSNDWIEFLIKNFAEVQGYNFEVYGSYLLWQTDTTKPLAVQLGELRRKYPALDYFDLVKRLYANMSTKKPKLKNIELYRGLDNSTDQQNVFIENYNTLKNFSGTEIPGHVFSPEQALEIRTFFTNLQYAAFQQSGFNRSFISFLDIVPHQELSEIFTQALTNYQNLIRGNKALEDSIVAQFMNAFKVQNNATFEFFREGVPYNEEPWRGKNYRIEGLAGNTASITPPPAPSGPVTEDLDSSQYQVLPDHAGELPLPSSESPDDYVRGEKIINDNDLQHFQNLMRKVKAKPFEFFTTTTVFKQFFNTATGRREKAPHSSKWVVNNLGFYDLVDQDSGEQYISNVDLETGYQMLLKPTEVQASEQAEPEKQEPKVEPKVESEPAQASQQSTKQPTRAELIYTVKDAMLRIAAEKGYFKKFEFGVHDENAPLSSLPNATVDELKRYDRGTDKFLILNKKNEEVSSDELYITALEEIANKNMPKWETLYFETVEDLVGLYLHPNDAGEKLAADRIMDNLKEASPEIAKLFEGATSGPVEKTSQSQENSVSSTVESKDPKTYTNYSGDAIGSDKEWEAVGREYGIGKQVNYRPETLRQLTPEQLNEVETAYQRVVKVLGRKPLPADSFSGGLVRRDYLQAKAADAVFAIIEDFDNNGLPKGGTAYAVTSAVMMQKPVYVFNQAENVWYVAEYDAFKGFDNWSTTDTPVLTPKYAGIGTRQLQANGKQAIRDVYAKTFGKPTQKAVQGINISTRSEDPLGRALTNPVWGSQKDGKNYFDVETWYKANKSTTPDSYLALKEDMNTMWRGIVHKFTQHPELVQAITERGGVPFLEASSHIVGVQGSRWEGHGTNSNFIRVLIAAYEHMIGPKSVGAQASKSHLLAAKVYQQTQNNTGFFSGVFNSAFKEGNIDQALDLLKDQMFQGGPALQNIIKMVKDDMDLIDELFVYFEQQDKDAQEGMDSCLG